VLRVTASRTIGDEYSSLLVCGEVPKQPAIPGERRIVRGFGFELVGDRVAGAEVHLVGRLAAERRVGEPGVVLLGVEGDQAAQLGAAVQVVHVSYAKVQEAVPRNTDESFGPTLVSLLRGDAQRRRARHRFKRRTRRSRR